ncbi:MAG: hypothetical protein ACYTHK_17590 [Planctomycetota bacterium]|jgi:hypothetical protein
MKMKLAVCAALLAFAFATPSEAEFEAWKLKFDYQPLETLIVSYQDGSARTFYALPFTITNKGENDAPLGLHMVAHVGSSPRKRKTHISMPSQDAEVFYRRMARSSEIKNVQQINAMKTLGAGKSVKGLAVFGTFDREWDVARVVVTGLEPRAIPTRVRVFGSNGFTLPHRAYHAHNKAVMKKAGKDADYSDKFVVLKHNVAFEMNFERQGDEFAPQLDPIIARGTNWTVMNPEIVLDIKKFSAAE